MDGDPCITSYLDVRDKELFDDAIAVFGEHTHGHLDVMFNSAGITVGGYFDEVPFDKIMDIVNINLAGVLNGIYAATRYAIKGFADHVAYPFLPD